MKQALDAEFLERILFSFEEMCYSVALALSGNQDDALDLERSIMEWIWNHLDSEDGKMTIKREIIKVLHKRFLNDNQTGHGRPEKQINSWKKEGFRIVGSDDRKIENG